VSEWSIKLENISEQATAYRSHLERYLQALSEWRRASEEFGKKAHLGDAVWELPDGTERSWPVASAAARRATEAEANLKAAFSQLQRCSELIESGTSQHSMGANTEALTTLRLASHPTEQQVAAAIISAESVRTEAIGRARAGEAKQAADANAEAGHGKITEAPAGNSTHRRTKRSTERGEGRVKLIAALTKHHKYADGSCLNQAPVGNNELARLAGVSDSTASAFFKKQFRGHSKYRAICSDERSLIAVLKLLNQEFAPHHLFGANPPAEGKQEDEE
jgi:hypothetical protein